MERKVSKPAVQCVWRRGAAPLAGSEVTGYPLPVTRTAGVVGYKSLPRPFTNYGSTMVTKGAEELGEGPPFDSPPFDLGFDTVLPLVGGTDLSNPPAPVLTNRSLHLELKQKHTKP